MKYVPEDTSVTFSEIPEEISLCINISGCPCHCPGCHSPYLAGDIGEMLTSDVVNELIMKNPGISCVCFMGGDADPGIISHLAWFVKSDHPDIKVAWYSGRDEMPDNNWYQFNPDNFDYIKLGHYEEIYGPLTNRSTNQRLYKRNPEKHYHKGLLDFENITDKFWK